MKVEEDIKFINRIAMENLIREKITEIEKEEVSDMHIAKNLKAVIWHDNSVDYVYKGEILTSDFSTSVNISQAIN